MDKLNLLVAECKSELDSIGIKYGRVKSVIVNTRAVRRWGQCKSHKDGTFTISISSRLLQDGVDAMATKDTIMHELLHTVPGCMNHGSKWTQMAQKVNQKFPGYSISRTTSSEEKSVEKVPYKYVVKCPKCGDTWGRYRRSALIDHPERYQCAACGVKLVRA